jgi:2-dehydropantoate 2-reductase
VRDAQFRQSSPAGGAADPAREAPKVTKVTKTTKTTKAATATKAAKATPPRKPRTTTAATKPVTTADAGAQAAARGWGPQRWPRVVVFGAGAVGCYFGAKLAQAGAPVTLIGRSTHVDPIRAGGLRFESGGSTQQVAIGADTQSDPLRDADLVLLCVKTLDTDAAARTIAALAPPTAFVVSMQNGVDNVERIARAAGIDAMAAVVYVAASMPGPGQLRHGGRGDLVLGEYGAPPAGAIRAADRAQRVAAVFERAGVPCPVSDDVRGALWTKLVMNCVFNAISALAKVRYGAMVADERTRALMSEIVRECCAVAQADGVALPPADALGDAALQLGQAMSPATSSTEQDLARGKRTEIESLNGYVVRRGEALGVPTPVNRTLVTLVCLRQNAA